MNPERNAAGHLPCEECGEDLTSEEEEGAGICEDCASEPTECSWCGEPTDPEGFVDGTVCYRCRRDPEEETMNEFDRPIRSIFAVDPGGHTGVAWGTFNVAAGGIGEALGTRVQAGSTTLEGDERQQIRDLAKLWYEFWDTRDQATIELVFEDFVLRPGSHGGGKEGTSPERIAWGFEGFRMGVQTWEQGDIPHVIWQSPGDSSAVSRKQQRLKEWGVWVVGREHERSAWSHIALRIGKIQKARTALR